MNFESPASVQRAEALDVPLEIRTTFWVEEVPPDVSDSEIQAAFEVAGGPTVLKATELIGRLWVHLNGDAAARGVRVYADN